MGFAYGKRHIYIETIPHIALPASFTQQNTHTPDKRKPDLLDPC